MLSEDQEPRKTANKVFVALRRAILIGRTGAQPPQDLSHDRWRNMLRKLLTNVGSTLRRVPPREDLYRSCQEEEDSILSAAGFEPTVEGWWARGSVLLNREAALQVAQQELHKRGDSISP